jgi:hypothetical protein
MCFGLSRVEIESVGSDPRRIADALIRQMPDLPGPSQSRRSRANWTSCRSRWRRCGASKAACNVDALKSEGQIIVNAASSQRRRRYTIAHELGHFLNERHQPTDHDRFVCTAEDMTSPRRRGRHLQQELEANAFAIEVLAPRRALSTLIGKPAELDHALALVKRFDISREAAIRRYVALHPECLAVVFSRNGQVRYVEKSDSFPRDHRRVGRPAGPHSSTVPSGRQPHLARRGGAIDWIKRPARLTLFAQTLFPRERLRRRAAGRRKGPV